MANRTNRKKKNTLAANDQPEPITPSTQIEAPSTVMSPANASDSPRALQDDRQLEELEDLKDRIKRLADEVQSMQVDTARNAAFQKAISDVKDEVTATRAMLASPPPAARAVDYGASAYAAHGELEEGCPPCECVSPKCCCFDVIMTHFRVVHMQSLEPTDTNVAPTNVLELRFFASIDPVHNIGAIIPDPTGWVTGHKGILEPVGMWVPTHQNIGTKCIRKDRPETITIELIVMEVEIPIESVVLNRDEYGSASETVTLDCCYSSYPPIIITVALTGGGLNAAPGVIDAKFAIVKKC